MVGNAEVENLSKEEAAKFYENTQQMQQIVTKYRTENEILVARVDKLEAEGKEDFEVKLKEMSHLLELEKLERSNIEAELNGLKG